MTDWNTARQKAEELVQQLSEDELSEQLLYDAPAVPHAGIRAYNWWNEALHGVARAGTATVFPQAIGLAAAFDPELLRRIARAIGLEGRAKYNLAQAEGDTQIYKGLTFWSPNINIWRDPRWGRGQETYGEDPCLTGLLGEAFVQGLQGDGPYLQAAACLKHFAVHSGPENLRHGFDARVSPRELAETYLAAFEYILRHNRVAGVMGAYNAINGIPCCAHPMIRSLLREKWGFGGYFVSDCGAVADIHTGHHYTLTRAAAAAAALNAGCDINCGQAYTSLMQAREEGLLHSGVLRESGVRAFTVRAALGEFDPDCPLNAVGPSAVDCAQHRQLNREAAARSMVLLQNRNAFLPLPGSLSTIAVIGPNALSREVLAGNYCGTASEYVTVVDGVRRAWPEARILYAQGCHLYADRTEGCAKTDDRLAEAVSAAKQADAVILCMGLDPHLEGEEGDARFGDCSGDRPGLSLPDSQLRLLRALEPFGDNLVAVNFSGGSVDLQPAGFARSLIQAWYPGAQGGNALADLLLGLCAPAGKLPVTFYAGGNTLPPFEDYAMAGRTYRYLAGKPLYPFGFGLSYTRFAYAGLRAEPDGTVCFTVSNEGGADGTASTQLYLCKEDGGPRLALCGVCSLSLRAGETQMVQLRLQPFWLSRAEDDGTRRAAGPCRLYVGDGQPAAFTGAADENGAWADANFTAFVPQRN